MLALTMNVSVRQSVRQSHCTMYHWCITMFFLGIDLENDLAEANGGWARQWTLIDLRHALLALGHDG